MLGHLRVIDLTDERGNLAASVLASMGAEVILVEPPGGSTGRMRGPFAHGVVDAEHSLAFWARNRAKRSVVLDLTTPDGRAALERLAAGADALIECGAFDVDLAALRRANPALVTASIRPFGETGPKAGYVATDLVVAAAGCSMAITGDADRPPVRMSIPQVYLHAGADAAIGVLLALAERTHSGQGQHVEVSAQRSMLMATQSYVLAAALDSPSARRMAGGISFGAIDVGLRWPCKDGFVSITFLFGVSIGPYTRRFMEWVHEEGFCDEATRDKDWVEYGTMLFGGVEPVAEYERVKQVVGAFTATKTKAELLQGALERRLLIAPVNTPADVAESPQFADRDYWDHVDDPVLGGVVRAPGPFVKASATPLPRLGRAPRLGEHTRAVLAEPARTPCAPGAGPRRLPLEGVKVLDLMWVMAGPATTRILADYGADVVRVESLHRLDTARTLQPFLHDVTGIENSGLFFNMNAGKRSVALNLAKPEAREVFNDLVRWADVVTESFSPRGARSLGVGYEDLRAVNPGIVMLSTCLFGQTGPLAAYAGYGNLAAAMAGFFHVTGWPDRPPCGPFGAYSDYVAPRFSVCAILGALEHRRRTGEGQYLDFAQAEAAMHFLAPVICDWTVNQHLTERRGNADAQMAPHSVYPCSGDDEWAAVACATDGQWAGLAGVLGRADMAGLGLAERQGRTAELDALVSAWTSARPPAEVERVLQAAGVPAHAVQNSAECLADPQLAHQGHFVVVDHAEHGPVTIEGSRLRLSGTPARVDRAAPTIGQDTFEVLSEVLGYGGDRIGDLYAAEALE